MVHIMDPVIAWGWQGAHNGPCDSLGWQGGDFAFSASFLILNEIMPPAAGVISADTGETTIHTLYTISSDTGRCLGDFMLWRTDNSATQRRRATIFRPATAAAHLTYDRHISERQSLNTIFTRVNPSIRINCVQRAVVS